MKDAIVVFTREELKDFVERVDGMNEFELRCEIEHLFTYEQGIEPVECKGQAQYCDRCQREVDIEKLASAYGIPVKEMRRFLSEQKTTWEDVRLEL